MELRLCMMELIIDLDELHKLSKRGLMLGAETWYDLTSVFAVARVVQTGLKLPVWK